MGVGSAGGSSRTGWKQLTHRNNAAAEEVEVKALAAQALTVRRTNCGTAEAGRSGGAVDGHTQAAVAAAVQEQRYQAGSDSEPSSFGTAVGNTGNRRVWGSQRRCTAPAPEDVVARPRMSPRQHMLSLGGAAAGGGLTCGAAHQ